ncbi:MAG TPA: SpoIIE family protein phosphatase [Bacteroidia bacterium]|nr:SpoIIE family protein phosphatase [Bacteroidia bacterium]
MRSHLIFKTLALLGFLLPIFSLNAQNSNAGMLDLDGVVYGYNYNPNTKGLFKKEKQIVLEGTLGDVQLTVYENSQALLKTKTNVKGEFKFKVKLGKIYKLELIKANHNNCNLLIDLRNLPPELSSSGIVFDAIELIMNSFLSKDTANINLPFGRLYYNPNGNLIDFEEILPARNKKGYDIRKKENITPVNFIRKSVNKNRGTINNPAPENAKKVAVKTKTELSDTMQKADSLPVPVREPVVKRIDFKTAVLDFDRITEADINKKELELSDIRSQLALDKKNAVTHEDSLAFMEKERILEAATVELNNAKKLISLQKQEISTQKRLLFWAVLSLVLVLGFLGLVFKYYLDKKKSNLILKEKNRRITESINYAKRIQHAILIRDEDILKILPNSFIYFQPLNIVSGDFYWISRHEEKIIVAAIDCTGHGVPGAFMSLICNSILYEIIMEKKILNPSEILSRLNKGIITLLRQDNDEASSMDGMELSLVVIDKQNANIEFAGAMNPGFVVKNGKVETLEADIQTIGGMNYFLDKNKEAEFTTTRIKLEKDMTLYLLSDGFTDQFGGPDNKKYNIKRFRQLLLDIQQHSMDEQKSAIQRALEEWKGNNDQLDDILIMGIRF